MSTSYIKKKITPPPPQCQHPLFVVLSQTTASFLVCLPHHPGLLRTGLHDLSSQPIPHFWNEMERRMGEDTGVGTLTHNLREI